MEEFNDLTPVITSPEKLAQELHELCEAQAACSATAHVRGLFWFVLCTRRATWLN